MTKFSSNWLQEREPIDNRSRSGKIIQNLSQILNHQPLKIIDLATGTGANLRYLCDQIKGHQIWTLIDHDEALLKEIPSKTQQWAIKKNVFIEEKNNEIKIKNNEHEYQINIEQQDLSDLKRIYFPKKSLITSSALLDLVSFDWLKTLAMKCSNSESIILFSLNYDGYIDFKPYEPEDEYVRALINKHQTTNKGFGKAMGPNACHQAIQIFKKAGYNVQSSRSDWKIYQNDKNLQKLLIDTWLKAAIEIAPNEMEKLQDWGKRRLSHIVLEHSKLTVGHIDLLGWL